MLASFMAGLALGSGLAAWRAPRIGPPLRAYAVLEAIVGVAGLAVVVALPYVTPVLGAILGAFTDTPWLLGTLRLLIAFLLMLLPTTAMGATLPVLTQVLSRSEADYGRVLGRLYGWNTMGAVGGALVGEAYLVGRLGLRGTAVAAALLNGLAVTAALALARHVPVPRQRPEESQGTTAWRLPAQGVPLLLAAALSGAIVLALEVVWFRFLQLFVQGTSLAFAVMLAVVLAGISLGAQACSLGLRIWPEGHRHVAVVGLLAGVAAAWTYAAFPYAGSFVVDTTHVAQFSLRLILPVAGLSGVLFTLLGRLLREVLGNEARTTGALSLANTVGAMIGSLGAGFLMLPVLGMERAIFALAALYALVALLALAFPRGRPRTRAGRRALALAAGLFVSVLALFPFGLMRNHYVPRMARRYTRDGSNVVATKEGLTETIVYLRKDLLGEPFYYRLLTNGFSMSATGLLAERYMKLFVYFPVMLHAQPRSALLISYGLGSTAKALTDIGSLETIDVVDISRDILDLSRIVRPAGGTDPLADPRVRVHVEDGRFFLQTSAGRFDIITGEPPPPKNAGIVSLYSREYFRLISDHLADGGIATYWLPVGDLHPSDAKAIIRAFCDMFGDCSLWTGSGFDWMLVGGRGVRGPVPKARLERPWRDPALAPTLEALGLELPEQVGAVFVADAPFLRDLTRGQPPLVDDFPNRLSSDIPDRVDQFFVSLGDAEASGRRFRESAWVREVVPSLAGADRFFPYRRYYGETQVDWDDLYYVLTRTSLRTLPLHITGSSVEEQRIVRKAVASGADDPMLLFRSALGSLAERDYRTAERTLREAQSRRPELALAGRYRILALCLMGEGERAKAVAREILAERGDAFGEWLQRTPACGLGVVKPGSPRINLDVRGRARQ